MKKEILELKAMSDHIETLIKSSPLTAVVELIWNALDADARTITVSLEEGGLGGLCLKRVIVKDDGHGIKIDEGRDAFGSLGGSPKLKSKTSPGGRFYHGKLGKGRLKALSIGTKVTWKTCVQTDRGFTSYDLIVFASTIKQATREHEKTQKTGKAGTKVIVEQINATHPQLTKESEAVEHLERHFSLYLQKYPRIRITYNGKVISPSEKISREKSLSVPFSVNGKHQKFELTIVEWKKDAKVERILHLCDENGITMEERPTTAKSFGIPFTVYLKSRVFGEMTENSEMFSMNADIESLIKEVQKRVSRYFKGRQEGVQNEIIASWQRANIYPYEKNEKDPIIHAEQQVFNHCALTIHRKLPGFKTSRDVEKETVFRLLRVALGNKPESILEIFRHVLNLTSDQLNEFAGLLQRARLSAVIKSASLVLDRIAFIESLEMLLFSEYKKALLETQQLQKILRENLWIFGEQYQLGIDDQQLKTLLKIHLEILGREELVQNVYDNPADDDLEDRRIDMMLYQRISHPRKSDHLIIELKRPKVRLGFDEISQIRKYAVLVAKDERFSKEKVHWTFVLLGNELDEYAETECKIKDREFGHIIALDNLDVYVKTWASVIEDAKWRYDLFYKHLISEIKDEETREFLQKKYGRLLPVSKKTAKKTTKKSSKKTKRNVDDG